MLKVGHGTFTWGGTVYAPGDSFDIDSAPQHQRPTLIRLYGLVAAPPKRKRKTATKASD
jgi:hypothetical protein